MEQNPLYQLTSMFDGRYDSSLLTTIKDNDLKINDLICRMLNMYGKVDAWELLKYFINMHNGALMPILANDFKFRKLTGKKSLVEEAVEKGKFLFAAQLMLQGGNKPKRRRGKKPVDYLSAEQKENLLSFYNSLCKKQREVETLQKPSKVSFGNDEFFDFITYTDEDSDESYYTDEDSDESDDD